MSMPAVFFLDLNLARCVENFPGAPILMMIMPVLEVLGLSCILELFTFPKSQRGTT